MWMAILENGTCVSQSDGVCFGDIRDFVAKLGYKYNGTEFWLQKGLTDYRVGGSASCSIGAEAKIESYWIQGTNHEGKTTRIRFHNGANKVEVESV